MNDLRLKPFDFQAAVARAGLRPDGMPRADAVGGPSAAQGGFKVAMNEALQNVSLEETVLAMQKAQIGFQATLQVRNRLLQAYSEIMNMQV